MPWVKFLKTVIVQAVNGQTFDEGKEYELPEPSVRHWLNRNAVIRIADPVLETPIEVDKSETDESLIVIRKPLELPKTSSVVESKLTRKATADAFKPVTRSKDAS